MNYIRSVILTIWMIVVDIQTLMFYLNFFLFYV